MKIKHSGSSLSQLLKHINENRPLTTFEVSRICGVVHSTVSNWIDGGKLNAYKTPGGHRRIKREDLLIFLKLYDIPVPKELNLAGEDSSEILEESASVGGVTKRKKILIVESDKTVSDVILESLKRSYPSCEFIHAQDGFQVGKFVASTHLNMIILDLVSTDSDGYKVLRDLRQDRDLSYIKIVAITSHDTPESREKVLNAGSVDGFISKPMNLNKLRDLIHHLIKEPMLKK